MQVRTAWSVPNVFSGGFPHPDVAIAGQQGLTIYDWWEETAEKSPCTVTPATTLVVATTGAAADA
jgi:hypothetical protein